jgi:hypothetical protein
MNKIFTALLLCLAVSLAKAQTQPTTQPFGKVDITDLESKTCDFEKDANAEILFHTGNVYIDANYSIVTEIHKRIKIFNDNGKAYANVRIEYFSGDRAEYISHIQAQTINLINGVPEIIKVDKKQIFTELIDKYRSAVVISFPNVKPGSVIEYKYNLTCNNLSDFPDWYFQTGIPTRYSQLTTSIPDMLYYKNLESIRQPYTVTKTNSDGSITKALKNIPSIPDEPFMSSLGDNCQRILFQLVSIKQAGSVRQNISNSWTKVGETLMESDYFGNQLDSKVTGEEALITKAKSLKTDDEK